MVAPQHKLPSDSLAFSDEMRAEVAYLRARGKSWDEAATALGCDAVGLRRVARLDPNFEAELSRARSEAAKDVESALLMQLHELTHDEDPDRAMRAVTLLSRHITSKRREETRLAVEQARLARAEMERAKNPEADESGMVVYLSAGDRRVTDTPLQLIRDKDTRVGGKPVYWATPLTEATKARREPRAPAPTAPRVAPEG